MLKYILKYKKKKKFTSHIEVLVMVDMCWPPFNFRKESSLFFFLLTNTLRIHLQEFLTCLRHTCVLHRHAKYFVMFMFYILWKFA